MCCSIHSILHFREIIVLNSDLKLRVICSGLNLRKSGLARDDITHSLHCTHTSNVKRIEWISTVTIFLNSGRHAYLPYGWCKHCEMFPAGACSVLHYSKSVGPWARVKIDDKTERKKPLFIQLTSKALVHYLIPKTSVTKIHLKLIHWHCARQLLTRQWLLCGK